MAAATREAERVQGAGLLDCVKQRLTDLPLLPAVLVDLLRLDSSADDYFEGVVGLVQRDPGFATRVIAHANTAATIARTPVRHLRDAIARLGAGPAVNLVTLSSVSRIFVPKEPWARGLWLHALQTGEIARALASTATVDPEEAYLTGLLHDIGRFILFMEAPDTVRELDGAHWRTPDKLVRAERGRFGCTHAELGYEAAVKWHLTDAMSVVIRDHHAFATAVRQPTTLLDVVRIADWATTIIGRDDQWLQLDDKAIRASLGSNVIGDKFWTDRTLMGIRGALAQARVAAMNLGVGSRR